ncbi:MAG: DUF4255 domain-containing protein [Pseudomonadota bacterium]
MDMPPERNCGWKGASVVVQALSLLLAQLNQYIRQSDGGGVSNIAVWGNVAQLDRPEISTDLDSHLVLTLVNLEEEQTLKNGNTFTRDGASVNYHNPSLHLNLLLLFTANYRNYETALKRLSQVISFFQGKRHFTPNNSPGVSGAAAWPDEFSLALDLLSLSFEEINHLWGSLGGRQLPFIAYRGRLVTVSDKRVLEGGGRIREVSVIGKDRSV